MKLRSKITLSTAAILVGSALIITLATVSIMRKYVIERTVNYWINVSYNDQIYFMTYLQKEENTQEEDYFSTISPFMTLYLSRRNSDCAIQIYNRDMQLVGDSLEQAYSFAMGDVQNALAGTKSYMVTKWGNEEHLLLSCPIFLDGEVVGCIRYICSLSEDMAIITNSIRGFFTVVVVATGAALLMSLITANIIIHPIKELGIASRRLSMGEFIQTQFDDNKDELSELIESFNDMSKSLEEYVQKLQSEKKRQQIFFNNATHELKTPLTSIMGYSQMMDRIGLADPQIQLCNSYVYRESDRLHALIERILNLSKYTAYELEICKEKVNARDLVEDCVRTLHPRLEFQNIQVNNQVPCNLTLITDREKLLEVILNLIDNSIKYSNCTQLSFSAQGNELVCYDDGQGVCSHELELLAEPFYQAKNHDELKAPKGNGIGLSMCKSIMQKLDGDMTIQSENWQGFKATLHFMGCDVQLLS